MIGKDSMIVFIICACVFVILMILLFAHNARVERRDRMIDEELRNYSEDDARCDYCELKLIDCVCEDEQNF